MESSTEGGTPLHNYFPGNKSPMTGLEFEDIYDLHHRLAVGPLHHYAAVSAFCTTDLN